MADFDITDDMLAGAESKLGKTFDIDDDMLKAADLGVSVSSYKHARDYIPIYQGIPLHKPLPRTTAAVEDHQRDTLQMLFETPEFVNQVQADVKSGLLSQADAKKKLENQIIPSDIGLYPALDKTHASMWERMLDSMVFGRDLTEDYYLWQAELGGNIDAPNPLMDPIELGAIIATGGMASARLGTKAAMKGAAALFGGNIAAETIDKATGLPLAAPLFEGYLYWEGADKLLNKVLSRAGSKGKAVKTAINLARKAKPIPRAAIAALGWKASQGMKEGKSPEEILSEWPQEALWWIAGDVAILGMGKAFRSLTNESKLVAEAKALLQKQSESGIKLSRDDFEYAYSLGPVQRMWDMAMWPIDKTVEAAMNTPILPKLLSVGNVNRNLRGMIVPAIERMRTSTVGIKQITARVLEKAEINSSMAKQKVNDMMEVISAQMTAEERFWTLKYLSGSVFKEPEHLLPGYENLPQESKKKIWETLGKVQEWMDNTAHTSKRREARDQYFKQRLVELMEETRRDTNLTVDPVYLPKVQALVNNPTATGKQLQRGLKETIDTLESEILLNENSLTIKELRAMEASRDLAKDIYELSAHTLDDVMRAAMDAEENVLYHKLKDSHQLISKTPKTGYVRSKHSSFKDLWIEPDLEDHLFGMRYVPELAKSTYNRLFMVPWKMGKVVLRTGGHFRNIFSNTVLNDFGGLPAHEFFNPKGAYTTAARDLWNAGRGKGVSQHLANFNKNTGYATTFAEVELLHIPQAMKWDAGIFEKAIYGFMNFAPHKKMAKMYQLEETWFKYAKYLDNIGATKRITGTQNNMGVVEAARDAVKWTFNYGEVTPAVQRLRTSPFGAPFATWTTKVLPLFFETLRHNPHRLAKWALLHKGIQAYALNNVDIHETEWETIQEQMPEWQREGLYQMVPWRDGKGRLQMLNLTWMIPGFGDIAEMGDPNNWQTMRAIVQNPLANLVADTLHAKKFSGAPLYHEWDSPNRKFYATFIANAYKQLAPALYSSEINKLLKAQRGLEGDPTYGQVAADFLGLKIEPIEEAKNIRSHYGRKSVHLREITGDLKRKLQRSKSPAERKKHIDYAVGRVKKVIGD